MCRPLLVWSGDFIYHIVQRVEHGLFWFLSGIRYWTAQVRTIHEIINFNIVYINKIWLLYSLYVFNKIFIITAFLNSNIIRSDIMYSQCTRLFRKRHILSMFKLLLRHGIRLGTCRVVQCASLTSYRYERTHVNNWNTYLVNLTQMCALLTCIWKQIKWMPSVDCINSPL